VVMCCFRSYGFDDAAQAGHALTEPGPSAAHEEIP